MHPTMFSHQVGWFDGKWVDIHPLGLSIKPNKWHNYDQQFYVDHIGLIELGCLLRPV
jgi:hypothetical protein